MKYSSNISNTAKASLHKERKYNNVTGSPVVASPDQLGIPITKGVFSWKGANAAASNYIDTNGLPFKFVVGGNQILLPPVVKSGGTPVPYLPDGLTVVYADSFMGIPIPADLFKPVCVGGKLRFDQQEMPSAQNAYTSMSSRAVGSWSNAVMINNGVDNGVNHGETLLYIVMSVFECLIYSYSSYPWGNQYNDLAGQVNTHRSYDNWLIYPLQKSTFLGNIINQVAPIYTNTIAPLLASAANVVVPGSGAAVTAESSAIKAGTSGNKNNAQPQNIGTGLTTSVIPPDTTLVDANGNVISQQNITPTVVSPVLLLGVAAAIVVLIIIVYARGNK